ncbi:MAG: hypothetical protein BWY78_00370 [Alphaproteobacteria bacterium ADurb.Bin438]|nr:MAG: hypothetical protein BWY78_00370 [Alphaproteobacteria bacterium ADurb.Bin438]
MSLISDFFKSRIKLYRNGKKIPLNLNECCAFSLMPEYDFVMEKNKLPNSYVMQKISDIYGDVSSKALLTKYADYIKEMNMGDKKRIVFNLDLEDAMTFNEKKSLFKSPFKQTLKRVVRAQNVDKKITKHPLIYLTKTDTDYNMSLIGTNTRFISIARIMPYSFNRYDENYKTNPEDVNDFVFLHEDGHSHFEGRTLGSNDYERHQNENFADTYSCLKLLQMGKGEDLIKDVLNFRQCNLLSGMSRHYRNQEKLDAGIVEEKKERDKIKSAPEKIVAYNTSKSINEVLRLAKLFDPSEFKKLNQADILKMAKQISEANSMSKDDFNALTVEIRFKSIGPQTQEILNFERKRIKDYGKKVNLGKGDHEPFKAKEKDDIKANIKTNIVKMTADGLKKGDTYEASYLNAYSVVMKSILNDEVLLKKNAITSLAEDSRKYLNQKDDLRPNVALSMAYDEVETPYELDKIEPEYGFAYYMEYKLKYYSHIDKVVKDLNKKKITNMTKKHLDEAIRYSKFAHVLSGKALQSVDYYINDCPESMKNEMKNDMAGEPEILLNVFKNSKSDIFKSGQTKSSTDFKAMAKMLKGQSSR